MKRELLQVLCEPDTGAELEVQVTEERDGEIWTGTLRSTQTGKEYLIRDGIPRFVPHSDYTESFGFQWNRFAQVQVDSANGASYSRRRFDEETGWSRDDLQGKWVLDAGCGSGRFAAIASERGARVIALDYSSAVDAAARNLKPFSNVHPVQGDILHPPFRPGTLDFVYSIGVLQHTPDPEAALGSLVRLVRAGGRFCFTIYGRRWYTKLYSKYWLRPVTRRTPSEKLLRMIERSMPVLFPVTTVLFSLPLAGRVFQFLIPVANYVQKKEFTREQRYQEAILDTFDMLAPAFDSPMTAAEVRRVFERAGVRDYRFLTQFPINVVGTGPGAGEQEPGRTAEKLERVG